LGLLQGDEQDSLWENWVQGAPKSRHKGLTGLALSGGGIRSSTLNLGILQVLHRIGLFQYMDYLSTVSGGGYLGSSISANYSEPKPDGPRTPLTLEKKLKKANARFPYRHESGRPEPAGFLQLRDYSNFLIPRGFIDYMKLPVQLIRGVVVNTLVLVLVLVPWIILLAMLSSKLMVVESDRAMWTWTYPVTQTWFGTQFEATIAIVLLFLLFAVCFPIVWHLEHFCRRLKRLVRRLGHIGRFLGFIFGDKTRMSQFRSSYEIIMAVLLLFVIGAFVVELQPIALNLLKGRIVPVSSGTGALAGILATLGYKFAQQIRTLLGRWALYVVAFLGILGFWSLYLLLTDLLLFPDRPSWWPAARILSPLNLLLCMAIVFVIWSFTVNANALSMHNFYRDRLSKAFLFRADETQQSVDSSIDPKLTALSEDIGPLHLVNTALNTRKLPERFRKGRHAEPFFLSSLYSGSRVTGYCSTQHLEEEQRDLRFSTAVATSGAAT